MPFDKYLQEDPGSTTTRNGNGIGNRNPYDSVFSHAIEFQIPQFIYAGPPTLAPGGGAEVLPTGSLATSWFTNNGFNLSSTKQPLEYDIFPDQPFPFLHSLSTTATAAAAAATAITAPSALGLPVYSASGFDLLSILARVATRPSPRVALGPVDLTCSFVVVDVRRHDHPIVYCSPSFCRLTGYSENEVLGRNCRFLQAPPNVGVRRGDERIYTDGERVKNMRKMLAADKECQISLVNYRRDASAFCNLVTVIPIGGGEAGEGGESDVVYHVGFQVDLGEQPNVILKKLKEGSYAGVGIVPLMPQQVALTRDMSASTVANPKKGVVIPQIAMSKTLKKLLSNPKFIASFPISTSTTVPTPLPAAASSAHESNPLSLILLEHSPDFVHVVSLKGAFLYVAPSVRRVLGWEPEDLVGKSVADLAHPEDVVPLMRELKEGSAAIVAAEKSLSDTSSAVSPVSDPKASSASVGGPAAACLRTVDMLFRARTRTGRYVWVESRGRLHVEPGKGRKAIVLSGRAREMDKVLWGDVAERGMCKPVCAPLGIEKTEADEVRGKGKPTGSVVKVVRREFWAMASGSWSASFLAVGSGVADVLGWEAEELIGRRVCALVVDVDRNADGEAGRVLQRGGMEESIREVRCAMARKDGGVAEVAVVFYPSNSKMGNIEETDDLNVSPAPFVVQIKLVDPSTSAATASSLASTSVASFAASPSHSASTTSSYLTHSSEANIFEELETARGTSWQYELEKLRFANVRLEQEIERLEGVVGATGGGAAGIRDDNAAEVSENDEVEGTNEDVQSHPCSPLDGPFSSSPREFEPTAQQQHTQLPQQDLYQQQYQVQSQPQYSEQQTCHPQQEASQYMYSVPQRQRSQTQLHLPQMGQQQQHQGMYSTTPLRAPVPQTVGLPPLLQHQTSNGYNHNYHQLQHLERDELDMEHRQKRMRTIHSQSHIGPCFEAQLPSRMEVAPTMTYSQVSSDAAQLQEVLTPSHSLLPMHEWLQQQQQYVPQIRGLKRAWIGHES